MRRLMLSIVFLAPAGALAQRTNQPGTGTVVGAITCSDTNLPAHFATVALQPVHDPAPPEPKDAKPDPHRTLAMLHVYHTHLDGTFQIFNVKPGRYYVVAENPGYLSPSAEFTQQQIDHPTPDLKEAIAKVVPIITVEANATSTIALPLVRAASIAGTLRFDDGSPAAQLDLDFERKDKDGKFVAARLSTSGPDEQGHFRASGVPPGEYRIHTTLSVTDEQTDGLFAGNHSVAINNSGGIKIFYGDTFHKKDATILKVEGGEEVSADITIPASKIHSLSGSLVDARTGHAISAGTIHVYDGDDPEAIATVKVGDDEPTFRFEYLPEGEYTVRVKDARDVTREEIPYAPGSFGARQFKETVLKYYAPYEGPLLVQADQTGLTIPIPALKPGAPVPPPDTDQ